MKRRETKILISLFLIYCCTMAYLLFAREETVRESPYWDLVRQQISLRPFFTIRRQFFQLFAWSKPWQIRHALVNLSGNVVLFIPLGGFLPRLWRQVDTLWKVLLFSGLVITAVEVIQVLTLVGRCDIDDLILNLVGVCLGYGIHRRLLSIK